MRRLTLLTAGLLLLAACGKKPADLDQAKQTYAQGNLDAALQLLEGITKESPGSPEATEATTLATQWLLDAADKTLDASERRQRLQSALDWSPKNGTAQARMCLTLVELSRIDDAKRCLDQDLADKTDVPEDIVQRARSELAFHDGSGAAPKTYEAGSLRRRSESFCADVESYADELGPKLKDLEAILGDRSDAARKLTEVGKRLDEYERLAAAARTLAGPLKNTALEIDGHGLQEGEAEPKKSLSSAYWKLSDVAADLGDQLKRPSIESDESYDEHAARTMAEAKKTFATARDEVKKAAEEARAACATRKPSP